MITLDEASHSARMIISNEEEKDKHIFTLLKYIQQHSIFEDINEDEPDLIEKLAEVIINIDRLTKKNYNY